MNQNSPFSLLFLQKWLFLGLCFCLPFSQEIALGSVKISLPTEPLIVLLFLSDFKNFKSQFPKNGIPLAAVAWLSWMLILIPFSSMPLVSFKFWVVAVGHFWAFFIFPSRIFPEKPLVGLRFYALGLLPVVVFALANHGWVWGFRPEQSILAPQPFFSDHTIFSAAAAMIFCVGFSLFEVEKSKLSHWFSISYAIVLFAAIYFSFCRAAWLSLVLTAVFAFVLWKKINLKWLALGLLAAFAFLVFEKNNFEKTTADGNSSSLVGQLKSMSNTTTDASNLERLNRWSCARRMFLERPVGGFGAGTFQFQYLDFQKTDELTRISVHDSGPHENGRGGGAHSEFFQNLAEMGLLGLVFWGWLAVFSIKTGVGIVGEDTNNGVKPLALGLTAALLSFFLHGLVNNFFHSEKISGLVWMMLSALIFLKKEVGST